jgi:putative ABC transport system permease protein
VRLALGAERRAIVQTVVGEGVRLALVGVAIGLALATALGRVLSSVLFGVSTSDPRTMIGLPLALIATAAVAALLPARRPASVDPMVALRAD